MCNEETTFGDTNPCNNSGVESLDELMQEKEVESQYYNDNSKYQDDDDAISYGKDQPGDLEAPGR